MIEPINDGGAAFPHPAGWRRDPDISDGMSLRDYFAAKAMAAELSTITVFPDEHWRVGLARDAYAMADAMLAARDKK